MSESEKPEMANTQNMIGARVRFAPSPTGRMHLGSGRTALYDYLLARKTGGKFILRIEDTDQKRYVASAEQELIDGLHWLGMQWDEGPDVSGPYGPYRQTERKALYQEYAQKLIDSGNAFVCFCTPERLNQVRLEQQKRKESTHYDGTCRNLSREEVAQRIATGEKQVIRFKAPHEGKTTVVDALRGEISVDNGSIDDTILVKSDGLALYHLAAMVDDYLMKVTHVFRGAEWLPSLPLHALIIRAFGWKEPEFIHLSVFLKPSGQGKMSKRESADLMKDGFSIFVSDLEELGYVPEAVVNWIALMGWSYDDHTEFFTMDDLIEKFSIEHLNPSPAAINFSKLDHFNGLHIRALNVEDLAGRLKPFFTRAGIDTDDETLLKVTALIQNRIGTLDEAVELAGFFFRSEVKPAPHDLVAKGLTAAQSAEAARRSLKVLAGLPVMTAEAAEPPMRQLVEELGYTTGQIFGILRYAVTSQRVSPMLFESMEVIGRETVLRRIKDAIKVLEGL